MPEDRLEFLEALKESYGAYYDIQNNDAFTELPLVFRADFFSRAEKYWMSKNIKVWGNETNEYVYLFSQPQFDAETVTKCMDYAIEDGMPRVKPHKEHEYTNFIAVFIADKFDAETLRTIKKRSFSKSYRFSLYGFSMLKTAAVDLSNRKVTTNSVGHDLEHFYRKLFAARAKSKGEGRK